MTHKVSLSGPAKRDIAGIYQYVAVNESNAVAQKLASGLKAAIFSLAELPERGNIPKELDRLGLRDVREIHFKPYRILYETADDEVFILGVFDGRRDMRSLLMNRLLRG
ncbi:MAG: type II toxin-antitoxin system RelE/ParE family toxin [Magnetovibrionaceae bacterium]